MSYTRKRGRVSNKRMYGGMLENVGPATSVAEAERNAAALGLNSTPKTPKTSFFSRFSRKKAEVVPVAAGPSLAPGASTPGVNTSAGGSWVQRFTRKAKDDVPLAPAPPPGKVKPDNFLVPMSINFELNHALIGSKSYPIGGDGPEVLDKEQLKLTIIGDYDSYIAKAKNITPVELDGKYDNEKIQGAVRQIVFNEFLELIGGIIASTENDSDLIHKLISLIEKSNELGFSEFSDIFCIATENSPDDRSKVGRIVRINQELLRTIPELRTQTSAPPSLFPGNENDESDDDSNGLPQRTMSVRGTPGGPSLSLPPSTARGPLRGPPGSSPGNENEMIGPDSDDELEDISRGPREYQTGDPVFVIGGLADGGDRPGEIVKKNSDRTYDVRYTDGNVKAIDYNLINPRIKESFGAPNFKNLPDLQDKLAVRDRVKVNQLDRSKRTGRISLINDDGTYNVKYDDGTVEPNIPSIDIELYTDMDQVDGGGARRNRTHRKRHAKRSKRKTVHYLRRRK